MTESQKSGFVSRWSRRKSQARQSPIVESAPETNQQTPVQAPMQTDPVVQTNPEKVAEPVPPLESLTEESSYERFMQPDIGADLRRLALRRLFKAPVFGIRDGLDDYDEDFTTFEALGNIVTADMKFHQARKEQLAEQEAREQLEAEPLEASEAASEAAPAVSALEDEPAGDPQPTEPQVMVPLKPADLHEPPPPILAAHRPRLSVRAIDADKIEDAKDS